LQSEPHRRPEPIDDRGPITSRKNQLPIHQPAFKRQSKQPHATQKLEFVKSDNKKYFKGVLKYLKNFLMEISLSKDIEPLSEFRKSSAAFMKRLRHDKRPIILTQHGKSAAVLMDVSEFERITENAKLLDDLLKAKVQVEHGKIKTMDEAQERLDAYLTKWK